VRPTRGAGAAGAVAPAPTTTASRPVDPGAVPPTTGGGSADADALVESG
jgi:hypothetical protein